MKKIRWPWPFGKKQQVKESIDLSDFKEELAPFILRYQELRAVTKALASRVEDAHSDFWKKIEVVVGHSLSGGWTFDVDDCIVTRNINESEDPAPPSPEMSAYEKHWEGMKATFYRD
jgi:hypothetical protein